MSDDDPAVRLLSATVAAVVAFALTVLAAVVLGPLLAGSLALVGGLGLALALGG